MKCYWGIFCLLLLCRTLSLQAQTPEDSLKMVQWYQEGVALKRAQKFDSSRIYFDRAHAIAKPNQYWLHYFKVEKQYARYLRDLELMPFEAISKLDSLIPLAEKHLGPQAVETGEFYEARANTYNQVGQYALALQDYLQNLSIRRQVFGNTHQRVAASYLNLAPLFLRNQQPEKAIRYAQLGADILKQEKRYPAFFLANSYTCQGQAYNQLGKYEQAKKAYDDAYQVIASNDLLQRSITFILYIYYAKLYLNQEDYPQVKVFISKGRKFAKQHFKVGDPRHARVDIIEVELAIQQKAFGKAEAIALEIKDQYLNLAGDKNSRLAMIYNILGQIMFEQGRWAQSHAYYDLCTLMLCPNLEKETSPSVKPQTAPLLPPPGTLTRSPRKLITVLYNQALSFNREGLAKSDTLLWAQAAAALNTCIQWIEYSRSALQEPEERSNLTDFRYRIYELAMANAYQLSQASSNPKWAALAFAVAERSRANLLWESLQRDQIQNPTALSKQIVRQQNRLESSIQLARNDWFSAWQVDPQNSQLMELQNEITRLQLSQDSLKYVISQQYPSYHKLKYRQEVSSLKQIQAKLPAAQQLLEYFYTDTVLYLLQIERDGYQIHRIKLTDDFAQNLQDWQQQLQNPELSTPQSLARLGHRLYQQLFPFELAADTSQSLLIIPDGPLTQLPFELLAREAAAPNDYRDIPYLFEQLSVRYAYAAWTLLDQHDLAPTDKYWAGFAPSYQPAGPNALLSSRGPKDALASLTGAEAEVKRIAVQMSGESYMGAQASKTNFLKEAASFKVLHLALHAYILEDHPMYSGLIFGEVATQDTLLLHEIYPLKLQSELTVLSACNTGIGQRQRGEGNLSLAHAFAYAGCPSVVMSLWPVNDQSTQDLMEAFYAALKVGHSKSKSLQIARKKYLQEHDLTHPYYWGAFVSIGDDAPLSPPFDIPELVGKVAAWLLMAYVLYYFFGRFRKKNRSSVD